MINLFPNTGIHFIDSNFIILEEELLEHNVDPDFYNIIINQWLPISFDGSDRDYSRIIFITGMEEIKGLEQGVLFPIIAIDTTTGHPTDGFLTEMADLGQTFTADHKNKLLPSNRQVIHQWLENLLFNNNINAQDRRNVVGEYEEFLSIILDSIKEGNGCTYSSSGSKNTIGEFEFRPPTNQNPIDVNLYLDLGNSRSVGLLFEDNPNEQTFAGNVTPLKILNYNESFQKGFSYETEDLIFVSSVEFAKPLFTQMSNSMTFKWPSIVKIGKEAQTLAAKQNSFGTQTGISGPKRYLWDDIIRNDSWNFSDSKDEQIEGDLLKYFSDSDSDEYSDINLTNPPYPQYPRRTMLIHYIIEILNQAYRQINSPEHRLNNHALKKRKLKRLVCSFPSGYTKILKDRFKKQLDKASIIFCKMMDLDEQIEVDLGLDEASASQIVFLESIIKSYKGQLGKIGKYIFRTDRNNKFRIASIDIGGGTTDIMVSEYDLNMYDQLGGHLNGEIKLLDSTQYGGDDIAKDIIEKFILPQFKNHAGEDNQFFQDLFYGQTPIYKHLKIQCLNLILWPLTLMIIRLAMDKKEDFLFDQGASLQEFVSRNRFCPSYAGLNDLAKEMKVNGWDIGGFSMENFIIPSKDEINKSIGDLSKSLIRTLYDYSCVLNAYRPSFVVISGKLSSLKEIQKKLSLFMPSSPDRIIFLDGFRPGEWYPFLLNDKINDPKTSVAVGLAMADISRNAQVADGCFVDIRMDKNSNINFIGAVSIANTAHPATIGEDLVLLDIDEQTGRNEYPINEKIAIVYRNVNSGDIPCNPIYKINLKDKIIPDVNKPVKMKISRDPNDFTSLIFQFTGRVHQDGNVLDVDQEEHINIQYCTILKNEYYLDNPRFDNPD